MPTPLKRPFNDEIDREIARMLVDGAPNKAIARKTGLALGTVKWRLHRMYRRIGVHSRTAFAIAVREMVEEAD